MRIFQKLYEISVNFRHTLVRERSSLSKSLLQIKMQIHLSEKIFDSKAFEYLCLQISRIHKNSSINVFIEIDSRSIILFFSVSVCCFNTPGARICYVVLYAGSTVKGFVRYI